MMNVEKRWSPVRRAEAFTSTITSLDASKRIANYIFRVHPRDQESALFLYIAKVMYQFSLGNQNAAVRKPTRRTDCVSIERFLHLRL